MGNAPWRPIKEIEHCITRGELDMAIAISKDARRENGHPIPVKLALELLPLVINQRTDDYDAWARHWLGRWLEQSGATIDKAADVAVALAELASEPTAIDTLRAACK
jgi:hypothetical protein